MKIDQSVAIFAAVAGAIALGAVVASGVQRNRQQHHLAQKRQHKHNLHEWEGEGGNLAPAPAPVVPAP